MQKLKIFFELDVEVKNSEWSENGEQLKNVFSSMFEECKTEKTVKDAHLIMIKNDEILFNKHKKSRRKERNIQYV